jgi:D-tyrosyl-tRNA(Tyr) deacylase
MIAVVQRVRRASVRTEDPPREASIDRGLCVLLGVEIGDGAAEADWIADKLPRLRIFADEEGRMNRDLASVDGAILLISQFTLAGDCRRGNRPSFVRAAAPDEGRRWYEHVRDRLERAGVRTPTGVFGASMQVALVNDGPVTLILERRPDGESAADADAAD